MTLEDLYYDDIITTRTYNACKGEGMSTAKDVFEYFKTKGSFRNLRNCGKKSYNELREVCEIFQRNNEESTDVILEEIESNNGMSDILSTTIQEIYESDEISVRTYNVCYYNDLLTIKDIVNYFGKNSGFHLLRNCGLKTRTELHSIYQKAAPFLYQNTNDNINKEFVPTEFNRTEREIATNIIRFEFESLSVRTQNVLNRYLDGNLSFNNIEKNVLLVSNKKLFELDNLGQKSWQELINFKEKIQSLISDLKTVNNDQELMNLKNSYFLKTKFSSILIPEDILNSQSLFKIIHYLINENFFDSSNENFILKHCLQVFVGIPRYNLTEAAEKLNITRERVRQIRETLIDKLVEKFAFVGNIYDRYVLKLREESTDNFLFINNEDVDIINLKNCTNFTAEFILFIIYLSTDDHYKIVGDINDVLLVKDFKRRGCFNWKNFYLLDKDLSHKFKTEKFVEDIEKRINERLNDDYSLIFKSYLSNFVYDSDFTTLERILPFAEFILNREFDLFLDSEDRITFKRNTFKQVYEYSFEALEEIGGPATVSEIYLKVKELYPHYETSEAGIRASMKRKDGFVSVSRTSTFGLKKWEKELLGFKGTR
ncbi:hypothetical protein MTP09_05690 [Chryseobacterium suipulveris]|uniref:RNA polymerase alpha subunit C-terminal domain-containing protein n=1 Tax=Chryseobacterium suipulveris TaxID=2929800 RepID=A0ABY4BSE5_9FLAO|nr:hypothetical protein [Chryseobacterium suipulveris]UOE42127.1 hypothetical protein MTP09_05690 [Chryseobacterium suipulveris]